MRVLITGASKGIGRWLKEKLENCNFTVIDFSRASGVDLTKKIPPFDCDILVLNAGVWENDFILNYEAPKYMALKAVEQWKKKKAKGHVIIVLSNAAYSDYGNHDYTTAKAGLLLFARWLRKETKASGILVSTISPGTVDTDFWVKAKVDNRKYGSISPLIVAKVILDIITAGKEKACIEELIITPA